MIFAVSASKEAWDDYSRYCSDKEFNEKIVRVVKKGVEISVCLFLSLSLSIFRPDQACPVFCAQNLELELELGF